MHFIFNYIVAMTVGRIDLGSYDMLASVRMCILHKIVESMVCSKLCFAKRSAHPVNTERAIGSSNRLIICRSAASNRCSRETVCRRSID